MVEECHISLEDLERDMRSVFGNGYLVRSVAKMHGGAQKVVYKLECQNGFACMLYVWDMASNYFQDEISDNTEDERSYGSDLFELNNDYLGRIGIRTAKLYYMSKDKARYPFDYAYVEFVQGHNAEAYISSDAYEQKVVFSRIKELLERMHAVNRKSYGNLVSELDRADPCHHKQLRNAKEQLSYLVKHSEEMKMKETMIINLIHKLETRIVGRETYGFIHGELGPDHVLVNEKLEPYLIDIEGAAFHDIEHEHSFLAFRFGDVYNRYMSGQNLDPDRMRFYRLHHHISCASGGLKLLQRGFPNKAFAEAIYTYNMKSVLDSLENNAI
jgi:hypothetical protein